MADPIQTARIVEAMARAMSLALDSHGDSRPVEQQRVDHEWPRHKGAAQAALSTAYPMIMEGCAGRVEAMALELSLRIDELARRARTPRRRLDALSEARSALYKAASAIRATELAKGEE